MIELGMLLLVGLALMALVLLTAVAKAILWVVLLPFRLLFWLAAGLILLPLLVLKALVGGVLLLVALPFLALAAVAGLVIGAVALLVPLVPFILLFLLIWYLVRDEPQALVRG